MIGNLLEIGRDLYSKSSVSKNKGNQVIAIFPAQFAISNHSEGQIGSLDITKPNEPLFVLPINQGCFKFKGKYVKSLNKYLGIQLASTSKSKSICKEINTFLIFDEVYVCLYLYIVCLSIYFEKICIYHINDYDDDDVYDIILL